MSTIWNYLSAPNPASGAIPFVGLDNVTINVDVLNFYWNKTAAQLSVSTNGDYTGTDSINAYAQHDQYLPQSAIGVAPTTVSGSSPGFTTSTSRGTGQFPQVNINSDFAGHFSSWIYTGTSPAYTPATSIYSLAKGTSSAGIGGELHIATKADGGALTDRLVFDNAGTATLTGNLTVSGTISSAALLTGAFSGSFNATLGTVVANGMYLPAGNTLAFSTNSARNLTIDPSGRVLVNLAVDAGGGQAFQVNGAGVISGVTSLGNVNVTLSTIPANGIYLAGTNTLGIGINGISAGSISTTKLTVNNGLANGITLAGSATSPVIGSTAGGLTLAPAGGILAVTNSGVITLDYQDTSQTTDRRTWRNEVVGSSYLFLAVNDAGTLQTIGYQITRGTTYNIASHSWSTSTVAGTQVLGMQLTTTALIVSPGTTLTLNGGTLLATSAALTNGAAAAVATMTNGPTAGNPTKWIPISDNGTTRFIPAW